jgi:hypothetical protein
MHPAITINQALLTAVLRHRLELACRGWLLARHADGQGTGKVRLNTFRTSCRQLGYRRDAIRRMELAMRSHGWVRQITNRHGHELLIITGQRALAERYRVSGAWSVAIDPGSLRHRSLRAQFFASLEQAMGPGPRARQTMEDLTGVTAPTQRRGERRAGAVISCNYLNIAVSMEHTERLPVISRGQRMRRSGDRILIQLPNSVHHSGGRMRRPRMGGLEQGRGRTNRRYFDTPRPALKQRRWQSHAVLVRGPQLVLAGEVIATWDLA